MLFANISQAPQDAILGLTEAFRKDTNPDKINLSVGVYQDETGKTPVLECVDQAEHRLLQQGASKSYLPITGLAEYASDVQNLLFGDSHEVVMSGRCVTVQTPGGTGALRVAADFVKSNLPGASVWVSSPTWPNHHGIFHAAGLEVKTYPYFNPVTNGLRFEEMVATVSEIPSGDVILLHGCCHNPTGIDPTAQQWQTLAKVIAERGLLPLLDFAYQGLDHGLPKIA